MNEVDAEESASRSEMLSIREAAEYLRQSPEDIVADSAKGNRTLSIAVPPDRAVYIAHKDITRLDDDSLNDYQREKASRNVAEYKLERVRNIGWLDIDPSDCKELNTHDRRRIRFFTSGWRASGPEVHKVRPIVARRIQEPYSKKSVFPKPGLLPNDLHWFCLSKRPELKARATPPGHEEIIEVEITRDDLYVACSQIETVITDVEEHARQALPGALDTLFGREEMPPKMEFIVLTALKSWEITGLNQHPNKTRIHRELMDWTPPDDGLSAPFTDSQAKAVKKLITCRYSGHDPDEPSHPEPILKQRGGGPDYLKTDLYWVGERWRNLTEEQGYLTDEAKTRFDEEIEQRFSEDVRKGLKPIINQTNKYIKNNSYKKSKFSGPRGLPLPHLNSLPELRHHLTLTSS